MSVGSGERNCVFNKRGLPLLDEVPPVATSVLEVVTLPGGSRGISRHQSGLRTADRAQRHPRLNLGSRPGHVPDPEIPHRSLIERLIRPIRFSEVTPRPCHARRHAGSRGGANLHSVYIKTHRSPTLQNTGNMAPCVER